MILSTEETWATDTLRDGQDPGAGTALWKPLSRLTLERYNLIFSQQHSRGYAADGLSQHDCGTVLENSANTLFKIALAGGKLLLTKWSVGNNPEALIDDAVVVADAVLSNTARPSLELVADGETTVRIFYIDEDDDAIHYIESADSGDNFAAEQDVGALSNVEAIASVSTTKVHCVSYSSGNTRFHCYEDDGGWAVTDSLLYWPHKVEHIDAITIGSRDLVVFYSPGPTYGIGREAGVYGVWYKHGRWSDLFKIDVIGEATDYSYRQHPMISTANSLYFLTLFTSEGDSEYSQALRALKVSKDGQNWSQYRSLVTCTEAGPAKLLAIDAETDGTWPWSDGLQTYIVGYDKIYQSDSTRLIGEENSDLQVDVTSRTTEWRQTRGVVAQANTLLANHDGYLDGHAVINADNTLLAKREAGYYTGAGAEYAELALEQVDFFKETDGLPRRHKQMTSRDLMAWMRDKKAKHYEKWASQIIGYDNYHDDALTGRGGLSHTITKKGRWEAQTHQIWLKSDNDEGIAFGSWGSLIMNGQVKAMIRIETASNDEYAGVIFRAHDEGNFLAAYYDEDSDKILLRQKYDGEWRPTLASSAALGWAIDTWYGIMVDFRYSYVRVFYSTDGLAWTQAFVYIVLRPAEGAPPEQGYVGVIGQGYSDQDTEPAAGYTPPLPPPGPGPEDMGPMGPAVAGHSIDGMYYTAGWGAEWEQRNSGLASTDILDLIWDPWWFTPERQGTNDPEEVILWACGVGWIEKKVGSAAWEDVTPGTDPPNAWQDGVPPTATTVTYKQLHGDMHNLDTFYALVEWQEVGGDWRGWIAKTVDNGINWTWRSLGKFTYIGGYYYANLADDFHGSANERHPFLAAINVADAWGYTDPQNACDGNEDTYGQYYRGETFAQAGYSHWDMHWGVGFDRVGGIIPIELRMKLACGDSANLATECRLYCDTAVGVPFLWVVPTVDPVDWVGPGPVIEKTINVTEDITDKVEFTVHGAGIDTNAYLAYARIDESYVVAGIPESRPLAMDVDTENGDAIYITNFHDGTLYCERYASDLAFVRRTSLGTATEGEVAAKTYFIVPRCPHSLTTSGFGEYVWVFGRYDDGASKHITYSVDGGATFTDKNEGTWDVNHRIGAIDVLYDLTTVWAFVNHATTPRLWKTINTGGAWSNINSIPVNVEFEAQFRANWSEDEEFLIGSNVAGAQMAAYLDKPYTGTWADCTGSPGLPVGAGYISAIIWI